MTRRAVAEHVEFQGARIAERQMIAEWLCGTCGHAEILPATEVDEASSICDFCSEGPCVVMYPCGDIHTDIVAFDDEGRIVDHQPWASFGAWGACAECKAFIDRGDQRGLTNRTVDTFMAAHHFAPDRRPGMLAHQNQLHRAFFAHRR